MYKKLSEQEIKLVLEKIRQKYQLLIEKFFKPYTISNSFEERYLKALKSKMDISVFLLAEIEAVQEIYDQEVEKVKQREEESKTRQQNQKSYADRVMEENHKKILKYPKIDISSDADEEMERIFGAIRVLIIKYWPVINQIYKNEPNYPQKRLLNDYYHTLLTQYDFKGDVPIAKSYVMSLKMIPRNSKKIDNERNYIIKETAFLLNEMHHEMKNIIVNNNLPNPDSKLLNIDNEIIKGNTYKEGFIKIINYLSEIINDFRIKDLKKNTAY